MGSQRHPSLLLGHRRPRPDQVRCSAQPDRVHWFPRRPLFHVASHRFHLDEDLSLRRLLEAFLLQEEERLKGLLGRPRRACACKKKNSTLVTLLLLSFPKKKKKKKKNPPPFIFSPFFFPKKKKKKKKKSTLR